MAKILKGNAVVEAINEKTLMMVEELKKKNIAPQLAFLRMGNKEDDISYQQSATKRCEKLGVLTKSCVLDESATEEVLISEIKKLNEDKSVNGVLILMPLPKHINEKKVRENLSLEKDIDGITYASMSAVFASTGEGFAPCTAKACMEILDFYNVDVKGKKVAIIGRSLVVGKPLSMLMLEKNATVTICHSKTENIPEITKQSEVVVAAIGRGKSIGCEYFNGNQVVVDVGINFVDGKMCGDVDFQEVEAKVLEITPVPNGVGTVTSSVLVNNVVVAAMKQNF